MVCIAHSQELTLKLHNVQGVLDAYFLKARGASESPREQDACNTISAEATATLNKLCGVEARDISAPKLKQNAGLRSQKANAAARAGKHKAKQTQKQKARQKPL